MTLKLTNRLSTLAMATGMDFVISPNGDIETVMGEQELIQSVRKAVVTKKQSDNYGTYLHKMKGMKNKTAVKVLSILTVLESLQYLKVMQTIALSKDRIDRNALLVGVKSVKAQSDQQTLSITATMISNNGENIINV